MAIKWSAGYCEKSDFSGDKPLIMKEDMNTESGLKQNKLAKYDVGILSKDDTNTKNMPLPTTKSRLCTQFSVEESIKVRTNFSIYNF